MASRPTRFFELTRMACINRIDSVSPSARCVCTHSSVFVHSYGQSTTESVHCDEILTMKSWTSVRPARS